MSGYHLPIINRSEIPYIYIHTQMQWIGERVSVGRVVYPI
jgi:hypothetical protein